jgi:hypothetical protein
MKSRRPSPLVQALTLAILLAGCGVERTQTPISPTPTPNAPPAPPSTPVGGTVSGVVYEITANGRVPVADVEVYCDSCGPQGHTFSKTGANGEYAFSGAPGGETLLLLAKEGYALPKPDWTQPNPTPLGWLGGMNVSVNGDTQFDIEIVRR